MKFATAKEHRDFFHKHGWIEFEDMLSEEHLAAARLAIKRIFCERLRAAPNAFSSIAPEILFLQGRDLWRSNALLQDIVLQKRLAEIAVELIEKKSLRLAFDQYFPSQPQTSIGEVDKPHLHFFDQTAPLEDVTCVQGIACGWLFALEGEETAKEPERLDSSDGTDIFPRRKGRAVFFKSDLPVNWSAYTRTPDMSYYMVAYAHPFARYILQPRDPHTHALKRLGYIFNDKLNDKLNPVVIRLT